MVSRELEGKPRNGPQGIPVVMFGHFPRASQVQADENPAKTYFLYISQLDRFSSEDIGRC